MRKTEYVLLVRMTTSKGIYRVVWENDGKYYVKDNGETVDVTSLRNSFLRRFY